MQLKLRSTGRTRLTFLSLTQKSPLYLLYVLFKAAARSHDLMTAAEAFQSKIRADAQYLPLSAATGMGLFHHQNITDTNIHRNTFQECEVRSIILAFDIYVTDSRFFV